jgi:hypothetical protein
VKQCPMCGGKGQRLRNSFVDPTKDVERWCEACKGTGSLPPDVDELQATIASLRAQLAALQREHAASAAQRDARVWIPVWERLPMKPDAGMVFEEQACIVTDGTRVGVAHFQRGGSHICDAWAAWSRYGDISPECITKWMPMPLPDAALAQPDAARAEGER